MENYGRYTLLRKLAVGGMAEVFLACLWSEEVRPERIVIKRILPNLAADTHFVTMFLNEARIAARLSHPNIVELFDLGKEGESYFLAMAFVHGKDLGALVARLKNRGLHLPMPLALWIVREVCHGLHYAHTKMDESGRPLRLIHRDISPQNIMVSFEGEVKILDFGIARAAGQTSTTQTGEIKGKYAYIAPEQARGSNLDRRCDIFSLALVLYELLTGHSPLKRSHELITLRAAIECDIEPPSRFAAIPAEIETIVLKALERDPDRRFDSAHEFERALGRLQKDFDSETMRWELAQFLRKLFPEDLSMDFDGKTQGAPASSFQRMLPTEPQARHGPLQRDVQTGSKNSSLGIPEDSPEEFLRTTFDEFDDLEKDLPFSSNTQNSWEHPDALAEDDESTITSRMEPLWTRAAPATAPVPGSLEEVLDAEEVWREKRMSSWPPSARGLSQRLPQREMTQEVAIDEEDTAVSQAQMNARDVLKRVSFDAHFGARGAASQKMAQEEDLFDEATTSPQRPQHLQTSKSRPDLSVPVRRASGGDSAAPREAPLHEFHGEGFSSVEDKGTEDEETVVDGSSKSISAHPEQHTHRLDMNRVRRPEPSVSSEPPSLSSEDWPRPSKECSDDEATATDIQPHRPPFLRKRGSEPVEHQGSSAHPRLSLNKEDESSSLVDRLIDDQGDDALFEEMSTIRSGHHVRSSRHALGQEQDAFESPIHSVQNRSRTDSPLPRPKPRPIPSAEVELIDAPIRAGVHKKPKESWNPQTSAVKGTLAERLDASAHLEDSSASPLSKRPSERLPDIRTQTRVRRAVQRLSILADEFDALRVRFGVPWSAIIIGLLLLMLLVFLTMALLVGS